MNSNEFKCNFKTTNFIISHLMIIKEIKIINLWFDDDGNFKILIIITP